MPGNYKLTIFSKNNGDIADRVNNTFQFDVLRW